MITSKLIILVCLLYAMPICAQDLSGETINICDDGGEWPPYTFYKRTSSGKRTENVTGFSVDLIQKILTGRGISFNLKLVPWKRCLRGVKKGRPFQMALNASFSHQRNADYYMTRPYYHTTNYYFYSNKVYPEGLNITSVDDLQRYRVCGLLGYNYETYGFSDGTMDQGAKTFPALISKLHEKRCSLFLEKYEILAGFMTIGEPLLSDPDLSWKQVPGMPPTRFHMLISKDIPFGKDLQELINRSIEKMTTSGELNRMLKSYIP